MFRNYLSYFVFKNTDCRTFDMWVAQYPDEARAEERVNPITIPGRSGQLTITEGEAVYNPIDLNMRVQVLAKNDYNAIRNWLSGDGLLVLGREPSMAYKARIVNEVDFAPYSKDIKEATIRFTCEPFKRPFPDDSPVTLTTTGAVINRGNVPSKPFVEVTASTDFTLTVNGNTLEVNAHADIVKIDCDAEIITMDGENILTLTSGEFFELDVGSNDISWTGTVSQVKIYVNPRWR